MSQICQGCSRHLCFDSIANRIAQKCLSGFKEGKFERRDSPRSSRRVQFDENQLQAMIKEPQQTARELA